MWVFSLRYFKSSKKQLSWLCFEIHCSHYGRFSPNYSIFWEEKLFLSFPFYPLLLQHFSSLFPCLLVLLFSGLWLHPCLADMGMAEEESVGPIRGSHWTRLFLFPLSSCVFPKHFVGADPTTACVPNAHCRVTCPIGPPPSLSPGR